MRVAKAYSNSRNRMGNRLGGKSDRGGAHGDTSDPRTAISQNKQELKVDDSEPCVPRPRDPFFIALFDCEPRTSEDLSVRQGEKLEIINKTYEDWWQARSLETHKEGYVPSKYVAEHDALIAEE